MKKRFFVSKMINRVLLISADKCGEWQKKGECQLKKGRRCGKGVVMQYRVKKNITACEGVIENRRKICKIPCSKKKNRNNKKQSLILEGNLIFPILTCLIIQFVGCKYVTKRAPSCLEEQEYELVKHNSSNCSQLISKVVPCKGKQKSRNKKGQ